MFPDPHLHAGWRKKRAQCDGMDCVSTRTVSQLECESDEGFCEPSSISNKMWVLVKERLNYKLHFSNMRMNGPSSKVVKLSGDFFHNDLNHSHSLSLKTVFMLYLNKWKQTRCPFPLLYSFSFSKMFNLVFFYSGPVQMSI